MANLCSMSDVYILDKIRSGEWVPSLDTGQVYSTAKKGNLVGSENSRGYITVSRVLLSHVIWVAAHGPIPYGMQLDHISGDKSDNRLCNLRLVSAVENHNLSRAKFTYSQAMEIRRKYAEGAGIMQLSREYGCRHSIISRIVSNQTYTKEITADGVSEDLKEKILTDYLNGANIDLLRSRYGIQQAIVRRVIEDGLNRKKFPVKSQEEKV